MLLDTPEMSEIVECLSKVLQIFLEATDQTLSYDGMFDNAIFDNNAVRDRMMKIILE